MHDFLRLTLKSIFFVGTAQGPQARR